MKLALTLTGICLLIAGLSVCSGFHACFSNNFDPPKIIMVKATLENRCSVIDETFVAGHQNKNAGRHFVTELQ